eukprot:TRINITY_DN20840_c0_g1_i1.p2 TRINITY_DN20840_c0_g1~~TRINITY_DN20840_c0_g1_i1.p2  ORF type:complete len:180 (-),score=59.38 TRINITY_DN20840_c0_g1_i1:114-614(-)
MMRMIFVALVALAASALASNSCEYPRDGEYNCILPDIPGYSFEITEGYDNPLRMDQQSVQVRSNGCVYNALYHAEDDDTFILDQVQCLTDCSVIGYDCSFPATIENVEFIDDDDCTSYRALSNLGNVYECTKTTNDPNSVSISDSGAGSVVASLAIVLSFVAIALF